MKPACRGMGLPAVAELIVLSMLVPGYAADDRLFQAKDLIEIEGDCVNAERLLVSVVQSSDRSSAEAGRLYLRYCQQRLGKQKGTLGGNLFRNSARTGRKGTDIRIIRTIPVGKYPQYLALTPKEDELYIANLDSNTVTVIDTRMQRVTHTLPGLPHPAQMVASPDGSRVYVNVNAAWVGIINTDRKTVAVVETHGPVQGLALTPDGQTLYIAAERQGLRRMDTRTNAIAVVSSVPAPMRLAITPDDSTLYVNYQSRGPGGSEGHDAIGRFDARTGQFLGSITGLANVGMEIAVSPDGKRVWADGADACFSRAYDHLGCPIVPGGIVNVLDTKTQKLVFSVPLSSNFFPRGIAFAEGGRLAALSDMGLFLLDADTGETVASIPNGHFYQSVFSKTGHRGYAALVDENAVAVLELQTKPH